MILVPEINIWTPPSEWPTWMFERIMRSVSVFPHGSMVPEDSAGVVTVSGESINDVAAGARLYRAALVFRTDGTVDKIENTTTTQIDSSTDWIIPNGDADSTYDVRYTSNVGDALHSSTSLSEDTWGAMSTDRFFEQRTNDIEQKTSTFTIEVRKDGGSVIDSASYTLNVERLL